MRRGRERLSKLFKYSGRFSCTSCCLVIEQASEEIREQSFGFEQSILIPRCLVAQFGLHSRVLHALWRRFAGDFLLLLFERFFGEGREPRRLFCT
jgi:hypothetical protein